MTVHAPRAVLRQDCDRAIMLVGLTGAVVVAWTHLLSGAGLAMNEMDMGGGRVMMMPPAWTLGYATVVFCMWTTMMVAMMLPSAAATILRAASLTQEHPGGMSGTPTAMFFTAGYLMVWTGFSGVATLAQWVLDRVGLCQRQWRAAARSLPALSSSSQASTK